MNLRLALMFFTALVGSAPQFAQAKWLEHCASLLAAKNKRFEHTFKLPDQTVQIAGRVTHFIPQTIIYHDKYEIATVKPEDGLGEWFVVRHISKINLNRQLQTAVLAYPAFFARFDIYADDEFVVVPNEDRINIRMANSIRFADVPFYKDQSYSDFYFNSKMRQGLIPLATHGEFFVHDRLFEHLLGSLVIPKWLAEQFFRYPDIEHAWLRTTQIFRKNNDAKLVFESSLDRPSKVWDSLSGRFGAFVYRLARSHSIHYRDVDELTQLLKNISDELTPGPKLLLAETLAAYVMQNPEAALLVQIEINTLAKKFNIAPVTVEFARQEAFRILHEVTGQSLNNLFHIWAHKL